jgi:putative peptidoglycan lipid II flippase
MSNAWRSLVPVNALVLAQLVVGLLNNVAIAAWFGLTRDVDAFYAAMMLPNLFMFLCVDYLGKNFLPVLALARKEGETSASQMVSAVVTIAALGGALVAVALASGASLLFAVLLPGFDEADTALVARYFWIMAPAVMLMAINTFHEYVCQYDEDFVSVSAIRVALPAMNLVAILALAPVLREYCLPVGYLAGHATMFVLLASRARYAYRPRLTLRKHLERQVFANAAIVMSTGLIARTRSIVINALASTLGGGAIAALAFATKLTEPLERAAFSGGRMLIFTRAARLYADDRLQELGRLYAVAIRVSFMVLAPLLAWVALNSDVLVAALFARGEFTAEMTALVGAVLAASTPAVLVTGTSQLLANAFYAMGRVRVPAVVLPFGMLVFVVAALLLARALGAQGIALAITLSATCVCAALLAALARAIRTAPWGHVALQSLGYAALGTAVMGALTIAARELGGHALAAAGASLLCGTAVYFGVLAAAGDDALRTVTRIGRQWFVGEPQRVAPP